jgi:heptosyltransferase-2
MENNKKRILIVKLGAIGDIVMVLPLLTAIDKKYPGAEITWLCGKIVEPILSCVPRINKLIVVNEKNVLAGNPAERVFEILRTWIKLFLKKYDIVLIPYRDTRYKILTAAAICFEIKTMSGKSRTETFIPGRYHGSEYAKMILGNDDWQAEETGFPEINITPGEFIKNEVKKLTGKKVILNPGGAKNLINGGELRRWPAEYYSLLAARLLDKGYTVILIGAEQDKWVLEYFKDMPVINLLGKTSLTDLIYLFRGCDILVSHDTSAFHLAKLSDINIIGLFGPVNPAERTGVKEKVTNLYVGDTLPCSPCYDGKNFADCSNNICMKNITVDMVEEAVNGKSQSLREIPSTK